MSIKNQLRTYYARQGLTGQHLRKALRYDMRAIQTGPQLLADATCIAGRLSWHATPQGSDYWLNRAIGNGK